MSDGLSMPDNRAFPKSVQPGIPKLAAAPDGWSMVPMRAIMQPVQRPVKLVDDETYQLVTARRSRGGIVAREQLTGRNILTKTQFRTHANDFLISRRQIAHGACGVVPAELHGAIVSNEYTTLVPRERTHLGFLKHLSHSIYFQQTCFHSSIGVHVEKLVFDLEKWLDWQFVIPPPQEQRRIAAVLDAWDEGLATTEALTRARQRQKNTLLAQVFVANSTSTGINANGWHFRVCDLANVIRGIGYDPKTDIVSGAGVAVLTAAHIQNNRVNFEVEAITIKEDRASSEQLARPNDIIVCMSNGSRHLVGKAGRLKSKPDKACGAGAFCATLRPKTEEYADVLTQAFQSNRYREHLHVALAGSAIGNLTPTALGSFEFNLACDVSRLRVFTLLDQEIDHLNELKDRLHVQKRGLMQKLLTGAWRVPASADALMPGGRIVAEAAE